MYIKNITVTLKVLENYFRVRLSITNDLLYSQTNKN